MEQAFLAAFVLANQSIGDVQDDMIAQIGHGIDFGHGGGEPIGIRFEAADVVHTAHRQSIKVSRNAGAIMIQKRSNVDDLRNLAGQEL